MTLEEFIGHSFERASNRPPPTALQQEMHEFFQASEQELEGGNLGDFFRHLMEASKSGEDLSSLTESAPQALRDFAEHRGQNISELLNEISADMQAKWQ